MTFEPRLNISPEEPLILVAQCLFTTRTNVLYKIALNQLNPVRFKSP